MKKIIVSYLIVLLFSLSFNEVSAANNYEEIDTKIIDTKIDAKYLVDEYLAIGKSNSYYLDIDYQIEGEVIEYIDYNNYRFYLNRFNNQYYLVKLDKTLMTKVETLLDFIPKDLKIYQDILIIVGTQNNNAICYRYNTNNVALSKYVYGGLEYECYDYIFIQGDDIYLFGQKNGTSPNSPFINSGKINDIKSFIVKLNDSFEVKDAFYINEETELEQFVDIAFATNSINFIIKDSKQNYYQYKIDYEFKIIDRFIISDYFLFQDIRLEITSNQDAYIYTYIKNQKVYYCIFNNNIVYETYIKDGNSLFDTTLQKGQLSIISSFQNVFAKTKIKEYHINKFGVKINRFNDTNFEDTNHFDIESYFGNLLFEYAQTNHINLSQSGTYKAMYEGRIEDEILFYIETFFINKSYINIVNEGIYPLGYVLNFTDNVKLNGKDVYPGETLLQEGKNEIIHETNEGIKTYYIYIKEGYDNHFLYNVQDADIEISKNGEIEYLITLSENKVINKIIVNNESVDFSQNDKEVLVYLPNTQELGVEDIYIEKIIFEDGTQYHLNDKIEIKKLKEAPKVEINLIDESIVNNIIDKDNSIFDVEIHYYQNENLVKIDKTYLNDYQIPFDESYNKIEVFLLYEIGNNNIFKEKILMVSTNSSSNKKNVLNIKIEKENEIISRIIFDQLSTTKKEINKIELAKTDVTNYFIINEKNIIKNISIVIGSIAILLLVITIIYRKRHSRKKS